MTHPHLSTWRAPAAALVTAALMLSASGPAQAADETQLLVVDGVVRTTVLDYGSWAGAASSTRLLVDVDGVLLNVPAGDAVALSDREPTQVTIDAPLGLDVAAAVLAAGLGDPTVTVVGVMGTGGAPVPMTLDPSGTHTVTAIAATWTEPSLGNAVERGLSSLDRVWTGASAGTMTIETSATSPVRLAAAVCDPATLYNTARVGAGVPAPAATADHVVVYHDGGCPWSAASVLGGPASWVSRQYSYPEEAFAHVFGHSIGLGHASTYSCPDGVLAPLSDACTVNDGADTEDVMGRLWGRQYTTQTASVTPALGWIDEVTPVPAAATLVDLRPASPTSFPRTPVFPLPFDRYLVAQPRAVLEGVMTIDLRIIDSSHPAPTSLWLDVNGQAMGRGLRGGEVYVVPGTGYVLSNASDKWTPLLRVVPAAIDTTAPTAPVITSPQAGWLPGFPSGVTVTWQPATDGGVGVAGYQVYVDGVLRATTTPDATSAIAGVGYGTHTITVVATDAAGNAASSAGVVVRGGDAPAPPQITEVIPGDRSVHVAWTSTAAEPPITGYTIEVSPGGQTMEVGPDARSATVTGLPNGVYQVVYVTPHSSVGAGRPGYRGFTPAPPEEWLTITSPTAGAGVASPAHLTWTLAPELVERVAYFVLRSGGLVRLLDPGSRSLDLPLPAGGHTVELEAVGVAGEWTLTCSVQFDVVGPVPPVFSDVPPNHPFAQHIEWMFQAGITTGYSDGTYRPNGAINRDAMAAFLYRYAYAELDGYEPPAVPEFSDVPLDHPFYTEISWLAETGITRGYPDGTFRPSSPVNRDAMAAFLYRFDAADEYYLPPDWEYFDDVPLGHQFFTEISWMADAGISTGWPDYTYRPGLPIARDAMAAFLYRFDHPIPATAPATVPDAV